jgi:uncharacterized protein YjbJ (UPF0337 family)
VNWDRIGGKSWQHNSGHVKTQWGNLTDEDIKSIDGDRAQLEAKIQSRYGYSKEPIAKDVDRWLAETEFTTAPPRDGGERYADRSAFEQGEKK